MGHHHGHSHSGDNGLSLAFWLNLLFSVIEVVGGVLTNSTAIVADAFHDFMDALAIGTAVLLEKLSGKKRTTGFSYGYRRFSLLSAIGMSLFLLIGAVVMCISAIGSFFDPEPVNSTGMLGLAVLGIAVNGFAFLRIKNSGTHSHHHGHTHPEDHNSKAIMLHLLEDLLGWLAVLIGAGIMYFTGWYWIDGALTLAISVFIGFNAVKNLVGTMGILLQAVPEQVNLAQLQHELSELEGVENVHDVHVWTLDGSYHIASLHAVLNSMEKSDEAKILSAINSLLEKNHIQHPTIQLESASAPCNLVDC